jgi:hypothetical protein
MCFYQDESPEFYEQSIRKARREHRCEGCHKPIARGDLYVYGSGKYDGDFYDFKTCGVCELDRHRIHIMELSEGCRSAESWCPVDELGNTLPDYGIDFSSREHGQRWLSRQRATGEMGVAPKAGWDQWAREKRELQTMLVTGEVP